MILLSCNRHIWVMLPSVCMCTSSNLQNPLLALLWWQQASLPGWRFECASVYVRKQLCMLGIRLL